MERDKAVTRMTQGIFLVMFTMSACNTISSALLTDIIEHYQLEAAMQGVLTVFQSVGGLLALVAALWAVGRVTKPAIVAVLSVMMAAAMLGMALGPPLYGMLACYVIYGMAKGFNDATASATIADLHQGRRSAKYIGALHGVFGIGGLTAPLLIVLLKEQGAAWNGVYLAFGILALASLGLYMAAYGVTKKPLAATFAQGTLRLTEVKVFFSTRRNWLLLGAVGCFGLYQMCYALWISRFVEMQFDAAAMGALALSLFWIGTAVSRITFPHIKTSAANIIIWGNTGAFAVAVIGIWSQNMLFTLASSLLAGLGSGAVMSMLLYIGCSWYRENTLFTTVSMFVMFYIGQLVGPPMVGGIGALWGIPAGLTVAMLFAPLSAVLSLPLRKEAL